jgi:hypothetical protein
MAAAGITAAAHGLITSSHFSEMAQLRSRLAGALPLAGGAGASAFACPAAGGSMLRCAASPVKCAVSFRTPGHVKS